MYEDELSELDLFVGSKRSYETYKRENRIQEDEPSDEEEKRPTKPENSKVAVLSKNTLKTVSDDMMAILKRTRCAHDYTEVYMQASLEFYDEFYNDTSISDEMKAVRQIRRVYKNYADYLTAVEIRNQYIDTLIEKYGGEIEFQKKLSMGLVRDWIPNMPVMSKKSDDYEMYLTGMVPTTVVTQPEGTTKEVLEAMQEEVEDLTLEKDFGVESSIGVIKDYDEYTESALSSYGYDRKGSTVSVSDLDELNRIFKSWYKHDGGDSNKHELFKNAPENIKKRFYNYCSFNEPGLLSRVGHGEEITEPLPDPNEMVRDAVSGKSMTRKELQQRETIRLLAKNGWSESRLLNYSNVGSSLERMSRKRKASKKRRKRPGTDENEMFVAMNSPMGLDPTYADNEYLSDAFMSLMKGD